MEKEELSLENILDGDDFAALINNETETSEVEETTSSEEEDSKEKDDNIPEVNFEELFEATPESVGNGDNKKEKKSTSSNESTSTSPKNTFSSIAKAFVEEGILPDLTEEDINNIDSPETLKEAINNYIQSELSEQQKRIKSALEEGVAPEEVRNYEAIINNLESVTEDILEEESERGENLRKSLIFQDLLNKGYSKDKAEKTVSKIFSRGDDIEDAKDALKDNLDYYKSAYSNLLKQAEKQAEAKKEEYKKREERMKTLIMDSKSNLFEDYEIDKKVREKIYKNLFVPTHRDPSSGSMVTELQRYQMENPEEYYIKLATLFTLTDGFKSLNKVVGSKVKKEMKKGFRALEDKINSSSRTESGALDFFSGNDPESYIGKDIEFAI